MDALRERMKSDLDVIMVGPWLSWLARACEWNGWGLIWTLSWLPMDAPA